MKLINVQKVKQLLQSHNKKNKELADYLGIPASVVSESLNGNRPLSMNHIFELGTFFNVDPKSLTYDIKKSQQQTTSKGK